MDATPIVVRLKGGSTINLQHVIQVIAQHKEGEKPVQYYEINKSDDDPIDNLMVYVGHGVTVPIFDPADIASFMVMWASFQWSAIG